MVFINMRLVELKTILNSNNLISFSICNITTVYLIVCNLLNNSFSVLIRFVLSVAFLYHRFLPAPKNLLHTQKNFLDLKNFSSVHLSLLSVQPSPVFTPLHFTSGNSDFFAILFTLLTFWNLSVRTIFLLFLCSLSVSISFC